MSPDVVAGEEDIHLPNPQSAIELKDKLRAFAYVMDPKRSPTVSRSSTQLRFSRTPSGGGSALSMTRTSRKREGEDNPSELAASSPATKKKRTTTKERSAGDPYQVKNNLVDSLQPDLLLVFIGLNPGLTTAATGHAYSHSSNLFWKLLHSSGVTPIQHRPSDTHDLPDLYSIGNTNICERPTRTGDGLAKQELEEGAHILESKMAHYKPDAVCIVGKGIWDTIYKVKTGKVLKKGEFNYGWQKEELWLGKIITSAGSVLWKGSRTFVATTTSGLAAGMSLQQKKDIWEPLGTWLKEHREKVVVDQTTTNPTDNNGTASIKAEADITSLLKQEDESA